MEKQYLEQERLIFEYTNFVREKNGLERLVWDDDLALIARKHSKDMISRQYFDHVNLEGEDASKRALKENCVIRKDLGNGWYSEGVGENLSKMPTGNVQSLGYVKNDSDTLAKAHVYSWMHSPGHKENLLSPKYERLGVGIQFDGKYYYATQNFF